jgi:Caspase domain
MGKRRLLVIGSQCDALEPPLSFLPEVAERLYAVMLDPALGECVPALSAALLRDPTVKQVKDALRSAFKLASQNDDTLLIAFIGHGSYAGKDFYLLPKDAVPVRFDSDTAVNIVGWVKELYRNYSNVDGLVLLLDTCYSGKAAEKAASEWVGEFQEKKLRFEVLSDHERVCGGDHPETLKLRHNIAYWTDQTGEALQALELYQNLLPDEERILGAEHWMTNYANNRITYLGKKNPKH